MTERNPMTDKLPEWVEQWIAKYSQAKHGMMIAECDVRAFLAQFVLCSHEVAALLDVSTGTPYKPKLTIEEAGPFQPLHAPATKEPKE